jgi:phenylpropionate dioxygenase-like ring-hydroxylating dioxygenase large terminal subunit
MFVSKNWYCGARSTELKKSPLSRKIIGVDIALFRDELGVAHALSATCAHRGGDLSKGKCVKGGIQCPWHGWRYGASGKCVDIPSLGEDGNIPNLAKVPRYPVHESQGFLYIWMNPEVEPDWLPHSHDMFEARYHSPTKERFQKGIFIHTLETAIEDSHLAFAHAETIGADAWDTPGQAKLAKITNVRVDEDGRGVSGDQIWPPELKANSGSVRRWLNRAVTGTTEGIRTLDKEYRVEITGFISHSLTKPDGHKLIVYAYITPADEFHNWFFTGVIDTAPKRGILGNLAYKFLELQMGTRVLTEDEDMIVSALSQRNPGGHSKPIFVNADSMGLAFRRMYGRAVQAEGKEPAWPA